MNSRKKMMNEPSSEKRRWSLRKLSVGMTSVLLGTTMFWASGAGSQVKADTTTASSSAQNQGQAATATSSTTTKAASSILSQADSKTANSNTSQAVTA
ncbi:hypothetical protein BTI34_08745, partial [Lactobacillus delbrueckii subsp. bulgaricus]|nr:hypothetical protein [Lactobacillus delbrueckii subsp. bulgaricus]